MRALDLAPVLPSVLLGLTLGLALPVSAAATPPPGVEPDPLHPPEAPTRGAAASGDPAAPPEGARGAPDASSLARRVQGFYDALETYEARFVQTYTRLATSRTTESSGRFFLKKGGKVRWDYDDPEPKLFVADGSTLWVYEPLEEQVLVDRAFSTQKLSGSLAFLWGEGQLSEDFEIALAEPAEHGFAKGASALELVPKTDRTYRRLVVRVDPGTGRVEESVVYETAGNRNRFRFFEPKLNAGLDDGLFSFVPPEGVYVENL